MLNSKFSLKAIKFEDFLSKNDVTWMSSNLLGIDYSDLKKLIYPSPKYRFFTISKKNGTKRVIHDPNFELKLIQDKVLQFLNKAYPKHKNCVHGFVEKRSVLTNAKTHTSPKTQVLLNLDLADFFPSITFYRVRGLFQSQPFGFGYKVATVLAQICTFQGRLPQGASTSPMIANLICRSLDSDLMHLAKRHRSVYTRYADDITFSFSVKNPDNLPENICSYQSGKVYLGKELIDIIENNSFGVNSNKTRLSTRFDRMEVTGLTINSFPNVSRKFIDEIRGALNAWNKHGYKNAEIYWLSKLNDSGSTTVGQGRETAWTRQTRVGIPPSLSNWLWGKLLYLKMIRGSDDGIYTKLAEKFNNLAQNYNDLSEKNRIPNLPVLKIVRSLNDVSHAIFVVELVADFKATPLDDVEVIESQGTAFACKDGFLLTCNHLFSFSINIKGIEYDLDINDPRLNNLEINIISVDNLTRRAAEVIKRSKNHDLALLKFKCGFLPHRFFVPSHLNIAIRSHGYLIGFPNWSPGRRSANIESAIITSTFPRFGFNLFEISQLIRKGCSGGPFVDQFFRVYGMAQQGAKQDSGNNECLNWSEIKNWL